jgi:hypothetical protein
MLEEMYSRPLMRYSVQEVRTTGSLVPDYLKDIVRWVMSRDSSTVGKEGITLKAAEGLNRSWLRR